MLKDSHDNSRLMKRCGLSGAISSAGAGLGVGVSASIVGPCWGASGIVRRNGNASA